MLVLGIFLRITSLADRPVDKVAAMCGAVRAWMPFTPQLRKLDASDLY